ncbi:hypothetical protein P0136_00890 [Lentisphaerota bacterium ZTH]|nr:hypothetical protein P0136_00890 [Lentisphaerota bacterium ZTH]
MAEDKKKSVDCPCTYSGCPRQGNCEDCQAYHHSHGSRTSCGK